MKTTVSLFVSPELETALKAALGIDFELKTDGQIVIADVETFKKQIDHLESHPREKLFILSAQDDDANMRLIDEHRLHHVVGLNEGVYCAELLANLRKLDSKKIWGLERYLDDGADFRQISLSNSKSTDEMIAEALGGIDFTEYFSSPTEYLQVMANELISNSLYKGPSDRRKEKGIEAPDRRSPVFLKGTELVQVTLGSGKTGVGLSVQDSFGALTYERLVQSLKRSFNEKTAMDKKDGAGLGLYLTFLHSNQFIVNFRESFRTEVICIIDKNKRYKNYKQRIRSFHFFQEVKVEKADTK